MKADSEELWKDLTVLSNWAVKWEMKFSANKCRVMQLEKNKPNFTNMVLGSELYHTVKKSQSHNR